MTSALRDQPMLPITGWMQTNLVEPIHMPQPGILRIHRAEFSIQPPKNLRKSNFFNFSLLFYDNRGLPARATKTEFKNFVEEASSEHCSGTEKANNGVHYEITFILSNGVSVLQDIYVRLVDAANRERIICYEGQDKNPEMRRVLLTHEIMCSRCCDRKSCGNRNETPSDPTFDKAQGPYDIKFFLKCNQNCLKNAGNPRDMRRFAVAISTDVDMKFPLAYSETMFVHNNSKHGRRAKTDLENGKRSSGPCITSVCPSEGWVTGGTTVIIVGNNFTRDMQVAFDTTIVFTEFVSEHALKIQSPGYHLTGPVEVTITIKNKQYCKNQPGRFTYTALNEPSIEYGFQRLMKMIPRHQADPLQISKEMILTRAAELLEAFSVRPYSQLQSAPPPPLQNSFTSTSSTMMASAMGGYNVPNQYAPFSVQDRMDSNGYSPHAAPQHSSNISLSSIGAVTNAPPYGSPVNGYVGPPTFTNMTNTSANMFCNAGLLPQSPNPAMNCLSGSGTTPGIFSFSPANMISAVKQKSAFAPVIRAHNTPSPNHSGVTETTIHEINGYT